MRILILGAQGDIGRAICADLGKRHDLITAQRRGGDIRVDITDTASVQAMYKHIGQVDAVISAAGEVYFGPLDGFSEDTFMLGLQRKVMGQVNLVLLGAHHVAPGGSFTLTSGVLNRDPIRQGAGAAAANGAIDGFVTSAAIEMQKGQRLNAVSPGLLERSVPRYGDWFPDHTPVSDERVGRAYTKSVEGALTGKIIIVE